MLSLSQSHTNSPLMYLFSLQVNYFFHVSLDSEIYPAFIEHICTGDFLLDRHYTRFCRAKQIGAFNLENKLKIKLQ